MNLRLLPPTLVGWLLAWPSQAGNEPMTPRAEEKLSEPLSLKDECRYVRVREWRVDGENQTPKSPEALELLSGVCLLAVGKFPEFVKRHGYTVENSFVNVDFNLSIIPDNSHYRNLNDIEFRFAQRTHTRDANGKILPVLGYFQEDAEYIYIYNEMFYQDKTNPQFLEVFAHELFHGMSRLYGVYQQHTGDKHAVDEKLAQLFTQELGLHD